MGRKLLRFLLLFAMIVTLGLLIVPGYVERQMNKVVNAPPYEVSEAARSLWDATPFIADLHSDALLWGRDLNKRTDNGHVDIPRLIEANVALQAFTIVSKTPKGQNYDSNTDETDNITALMVVQGRNPKTWTSLLARGLDMAARLNASAAENDAFQVIRSRAQLQAYIADRAKNPEQSAGLLGVEGLHLLEGELANVDKLYEAGFRMVAPVHFFDNEVGGSAHGAKKGGLTPFGKTVVAKAEKLGMLIDLSHASSATVSDVLAQATRPVIVSHTGVQATCAGDRNLTDAQLKAIAANGGLVGIAMFKQAVCSEDISGTARAIRHAVDVMGLEHVALGSDFDGAVTTPFDVTGLPLLVPALRAEGFGESEIQAIVGGNTRDFLLANLPVQ